MQNAFFILLVCAFFAACQRAGTPDIAPVVTNPDPKEITDGKKIAEWMFSRSWILTEYRPKDGERFFYVDAPLIDISKEQISYPELCNRCHYSIRIDTEKRIIQDIHKGSGICTELHCLSDKEMKERGQAVPPRPSKEFGKWADYEYRKEGDYLVLKATHGEYWLRLAPNLKTPPSTLLNTRWECYAYQKDGVEKTLYVDEPIFVAFGKDYLSYSPDCNSCTKRTSMSYEGNNISWKSENEGFACTEMACLGELNKDFNMGTISNGMNYRFEAGILVLENEKMRLYLRQQVF